MSHMLIRFEVFSMTMIINLCINSKMLLWICLN